jgi:hypothetical protein
MPEKRTTHSPKRESPYASIFPSEGVARNVLGDILFELLREPDIDQAMKSLRSLRRMTAALRASSKPVGREQGRISINAVEAFALWAAVDVLGLRKADVLRHWAKRSAGKADYNWLDYRLKMMREEIRQRPEGKAELIAELGDDDVSTKKKRLKALL